MQWSYFIDEIVTLSSFSNACTGLANANLALNVNLSYGKLISAEATFLSHSALLNGDKKYQYLSVEQETNSLVFDLIPLENRVNVFKVSVVCEHKTFTCNIAFLPAIDLPQAVFVLGSPRSGTTVVGNMVQRGLQVKSHGESHMAELLQNLVTTVTEYVKGAPAATNEGTLTWEVSPTYVKALQIQQFRELYSTFYTGPVLIDKTPGVPMLNTLSLLFLVYPNAKVVYCKRRGIENVASRMRKFADVPFEGHCNQWKQAFTIWRRNKRHLNNELLKHKGWFIEVEQFTLLKDAAPLIKQLADFLALPESAYVKMLNYQASETPQKTSDEGGVPKSLVDMNWTNEQKQRFEEICGTEMERAGYSLTEHYFNH